MAVWVSGAAGKLGSAVVRALRSDGLRVVAVDRAGGESVIPVDLLDFAATKDSMAGSDAVIHLAARPSPAGIAPTKLVENNVLATFNACEAASQLGIQRVVMASSGAIYGYPFSAAMIEPGYVPVDEDSPLDFVDPYALTKDLGERIGQMYARRGMSVVALRPHWILSADELRQLRDTVDGEDGARNLWGYVELSDAARACVLSVSAVLPPGQFHELLIAAADTMMSKPTAELLDDWFPQVERRRKLPGSSSLFDCTRAQRIIGWKPTFEW